MNTFQKHKDQIISQTISSILAGLLVLLGAFTDGEITQKSLIFALVAACFVAVSNFKDFWNSEFKTTKIVMLKFF